MLIANPIYEEVFRFLLDDDKVARLVLSALLGQEVLTLQARPIKAHRQAGRPDSIHWLVLRLGFTATVRLEDGGCQMVPIEIHKARSAQDVLRFRRVLDATLASPEHDESGSSGKQQTLPVVTIYVLGEGLEGADVPVLKAQDAPRSPGVEGEKIIRRYLDVATGDSVLVTDPSAEAFTLDAIVVQINRLGNHRRTGLERMLEVFDQGRASRAGRHLLDIVEAHFPEQHRDVLHRLMRAGAEQKILDGMDVEDDILTALRADARKSADQRQALAEGNKALVKMDQALAERNKALAEGDKALAQMDQALAAMDQLLVEGDQLLEAKDRQIAELDRRLSHT